MVNNSSAFPARSPGPRCRVPDLDRVRCGGGEAPAVRAEDDAAHMYLAKRRGRLTPQRKRILAVAPVPHLDRPIEAPRNETPAIRAETHDPRPEVEVAGKDKQSCAARHVPDPHGAIAAGRGEALTARVERQAEDPPLVALEDTEHLARCQAPQFDAVVAVARCQ